VPNCDGDKVASLGDCASRFIAYDCNSVALTSFSARFFMWSYDQMCRNENTYHPAIKQMEIMMTHRIERIVAKPQHKPTDSFCKHQTESRFIDGCVTGK